MKHYKIICGVALVIVTLLSTKSTPQAIQDNSTNANIYTLSARQYTDSFYKQSEKLSIGYIKKSQDPVYGGVVPHHLRAAPLIDAFFKGIPNQPETVVLISPNHYNSGPNTISVSLAQWKTPFGIVMPDEVLSKKLLANNIYINEEHFQNEHGIYVLLPFIKKYLPHSKITPLTLKSYTTKEELDTLIRVLRVGINKNTLILVSTDFSHYQYPQDIINYDQQTKKILQDMNTEEILHLDNIKNVDSPPAHYVLTSLMQYENKYPQFLQNTNSAQLVNKFDSNDTTSYFTIYYK